MFSGFGRAPWVRLDLPRNSNSNTASLHFKHTPFEGRKILMSNWECPKCKSCYSIPAQIDSRGWVDCQKCKETKPHYKWSWKLNKAVRV